MPEPYLPLPPPEENDYHDPLPALCPDCRDEGRTLILNNPVPTKDGTYGRCEDHGYIKAVYGNSPDPEKP